MGIMKDEEPVRSAVYMLALLTVPLLALWWTTSFVIAIATTYAIYGLCRDDARRTVIRRHQTARPTHQGRASGFPWSYRV